MLSLKMALRSISANKLRAALTMLGIIIGVVALVVLVSLVNGATGSVQETVAGLGTDTLTVNISDDKGLPVTLETVEEWMDADGIGLIAPVTSTEATASAEGESGTVTVYGTTHTYYEVRGLQLSMGRWLRASDVSNNTYVCVIDEDVATELFGYVDCVDQALWLDDVQYTIVGVLSADESMSGMMAGSSMAIYLPFTSLMRLSDSLTEDITQLYVSAPENGTMQAAENAMKTLLMERLRLTRRLVTNPASSNV